MKHRLRKFCSQCGVDYWTFSDGRSSCYICTPATEEEMAEPGGKALVAKNEIARKADLKSPMKSVVCRRILDCNSLESARRALVSIAVWVADKRILPKQAVALEKLVEAQVRILQMAERGKRRIERVKEASPAPAIVEPSDEDLAIADEGVEPSDGDLAIADEGEKKVGGVRVREQARMAERKKALAEPSRYFPDEPRKAE